MLVNLLEVKWLKLHVHVLLSYSLITDILIVEDEKDADLWLLNSCTVKNPSEDGFRNAIRKAKSMNKHLVVAGCVPQGQPKHDSLKGVSIVGVRT